MKAVLTINGELPETDVRHRKAVVLRDDEWEEFRVRFYLGGKHQRAADYHTACGRDAQGTAQLWIDKEAQQ